MQRSIAKVQTDDRLINQLQSNILPPLKTLINNPSLLGVILTQVSLANGTTVIQTTLNRTLQGWYIVRQRASAIIYDTQDTNPNPQSTLILVSNAAVVCDIYVF